MYSLPTTVTAGGVEYHIRNAGDFRVILDCFAALRDDEIGEDARILASLIIFYEDFNDTSDIPDDTELIKELVKQMYAFMNSGQPETINSQVQSPLIDWEKDSQIICAAVNNVAKMEIRTLPYLHWWTFVGYYMSVGNSILSTVVSIRDKIVRGKKLEKWEQEYKRDNPEYFNWRRQSVEDAEFDRKLREQFHGGNK